MIADRTTGPAMGPRTSHGRPARRANVHTQWPRMRAGVSHRAHSVGHADRCASAWRGKPLAGLPLRPDFTTTCRENDTPSSEDHVHMTRSPNCEFQIARRLPRYRDIESTLRDNVVAIFGFALANQGSVAAISGTRSLPIHTLVVISVTWSPPIAATLSC